MENQGASVVITHHILDNKQAEYEKWLDEIVPVAKNAQGFIDLQMVRPIPQLTFVYTVIIRFDTIDHLKRWIESAAGFPVNHYLDALLSSGCVVLLMIYVVMPNYTRLIKNWLFR